MSQLNIPRSDQAKALLTGSIYSLLSRYISEPIVEFRPYLTLTREDIKQYLVQNPGMAEKYFMDKEARTNSVELNKIERDGKKFRVSWIDHGKVRTTQTFDELIDCVVEHVLIDHGMY